MLHVYINTSGDLGFDFSNKKPSGFFTVCALVVKGQRNDHAICGAIKSMRKSSALERGPLSLETLKKFFKSVKDTEFGLFAVTLDKRKAFAQPSFDKGRIYSYIAGLVIRDIDFKGTAVKVTMTADKLGQGKGEIPLCDYLRAQVQAWVNLAVPLNFQRLPSRENAGLQAAGLFARGVHLKNEHGDIGLYPVFKERIRVERIY